MSRHQARFGFMLIGLFGVVVFGCWLLAAPRAQATPTTFSQRILPLDCVFNEVNDGTGTLIYVTPEACGVILTPPTGTNTQPAPVSDAKYLPLTSPTRLQTSTADESTGTTSTLTDSNQAGSDNIHHAVRSQSEGATETVLAIVVLIGLAAVWWLVAGHGWWYGASRRRR